MMPYVEDGGGIIHRFAFCLMGPCKDGLVLDDLEAARRAYDDAEAAVVQAQQQVTVAREEVPRARERLHAAIVAAARSGARQVDIAEASKYRRERVRQILRAAGVEPPE